MAAQEEATAPRTIFVDTSNEPRTDEEAVSMCTRGLEKATARQDIADLQFRLANAQVRRGFPDLAVTAFRACVAADPRRSDAFNNLGLLLLRRYDYGAAATFAAGEAWVEETGGTEAFRAPERLDSVFDDEDEVWDEEGRINGPAADVYSLGVCCFLALTGTDPFDFDSGEDNEDGSFWLVDSYAGMLERLEAGDVFNATSTEGFHIPPRAGGGVSAAANAFVVSAMRAHPSERPTAAQLEAHAWLRPGGALDMAALGAALPG